MPGELKRKMTVDFSDIAGFDDYEKSKLKLCK